jgi:predicted nucleic acid-binding protein
MSSKSKLIAIDTNILIYALEQGEYTSVSKSILSYASANEGVCSSLVFSEYMRGVALLVPAKYQEVRDYLLGLKYIKFLPVDMVVAETASMLYIDNKKSLLLPDALHLATAIVHGCSEFWTNDIALSKIKLTNLRVRLLDEWK